MEARLHRRHRQRFRGLLTCMLIAGAAGSSRRSAGAAGRDGGGYMMVFEASEFPEVLVELRFGVHDTTDITGRLVNHDTDFRSSRPTFGRNIVLVNCDIEDLETLLEEKGQGNRILLLYSLEQNSCSTSATLHPKSPLILTISDGMMGRLLYSKLAQISGLDVKLTNLHLLPRRSETGTPDSDLLPGLRSESPNVALITLYAISGVITSLFALMLIGGFLRARRDPDRYGPRAAVPGSSPQSRAKGLARAVLDTLPIVRFGQPPPRTEDVKKGDIEMHHAISTTGAVALPAPPPQIALPVLLREVVGPVGGVGLLRIPSGSRQHQCPVCLDDFVEGEGLRVLPCRHEFHPDCVDPWLLNVSGSCPLCRIDLRPENEGEDGEVTPEELPHAPTVSQSGRRISRYLDIARGTTGEERMEALRLLRNESRDPEAPQFAPRAARSMRPEMGINRLRRALSRRMGSDTRIETVVENEAPSDRNQEA